MERKAKQLKEQSQATRIKTLLKKRKSLIKKKYETVEFNPPVLFLMRTNGKTDFYENATAGEFKFEHTDGEDRIIILDPSFQTTFNYGKTAFKGYIQHEDNKLPYPQDPLLYAKQWDIHSDKLQYDIRKHKATEYTSMGKMWKNIMIGIAIIIGVLILASIFDVNFVSLFGNGGGKEVIEQTTQNTQTIAKNITDYVLQ